MTTAIVLYGVFMASKTGKTGLTPTVNARSIERATGTVTSIASGASAFTVGDGVYGYQIAAATPQTHDYIAVFITADATVDAQHVQAVWPPLAGAWSAELANLDAAISSRNAVAPLDATATQAAAAAALTAYDPATGAEVAALPDAILDSEEVSAGLSVRAALAAAGAAGDPLANTLDGYASGTGGAALKRISAGQLTVVQPVLDDGFLRIIGGDDYAAADGRRLDLSSEDWPDLTDGAVVWIFGDTTLAGVVVDADTVGLALTAAQSAALLAQRAGRQTYSIVATLATGNTATLAKGAPCLIE